jgi:trans-aconitate 2-methyltransferase
MADWNAALYLTFEDERTRPARDLLARVSLHEAPRLADLGCGPGTSTKLLADRWPDAAILGVDTSDDMLSSARVRLPSARFVKADAATWQAEEGVDLIFANAVLQWVGGHARLFPRLMDQLVPGGILAVQMPDNLDEPSHRLMRETAATGPWKAKLGEAAAIRESLLTPQAYYDLLIPHASAVEVWRTTYHHPLDGPGAIVTWLSATGLKPFLDPLDADEKRAFLAAYETRIARAYPPRADGRLLLAFPRLFILARARARVAP